MVLFLSLVLLFLCLLALLLLLSVVREVPPVKRFALIRLGLIGMCTLIIATDGFITVYASPATPGNADYSEQELVEDLPPDGYEDETIEKLEGLDVDVDTLSAVYDYFMERISSDFTGPGVDRQTSEDENLEVLGDIQKYVPSDDSVPFAVGADDSVVNALRYRVLISGRSYVLLLPPEYVDQIYIDSQGLLWNVGTNTIQGRLFEDSFDPLADTGKLLYLSPCLGNNFSHNRENGSPNYIRNYYWSSYDRLTYDTTYVTVEVEESGFSFRSGDILTYVIIILLGGMLLCLWKKSVR